MGLHGWLYLILGIVYCLSVIGAILGVPLIVAGVGLLRAGDGLQLFVRTEHHDDLVESLRGLRQFFLTTGIIFLVSFILPILFFISFLLSVLFNPSLSEKLDRWKEEVPKFPAKRAPYDFGKGKEI